MTDVILTPVPGPTKIITSTGATAQVITASGPPGPAGPAGPSSESSNFTALAGEPLSGGRVARIAADRAWICDGANPAHVGTCVGITQTAALTDAAVTIRAIGPMLDGGWTWPSDGALYVGASGVLSLNPGTAFVQEVARARSATQIVVGIKTAILRG